MGPEEIRPFYESKKTLRACEEAITRVMGVWLLTQSPTMLSLAAALHAKRSALTAKSGRERRKALKEARESLARAVRYATTN